ncbi:MAG: twin-arginine translocation signal domain-containing protein, partial [Bacteroidota bacterium]
MKSKKNHRRGYDLSDPRAHQNDHQNWSRRGFLRTLGLAGATSVGLSALPLSGLYGFPLATLLDGARDNRKLVLIRLKGGNDGLNTIVPLFDYDRYANLRPRLRHPRNELIGLDADFAMPDLMSNLQPLWAEDKMRVVNSVGYPDHSLSHFTGADIMASGDNNIEENGDGWLARYYVNQNPDYRTDPPPVPPAIKIGGPTSILFNDLD